MLKTSIGFHTLSVFQRLTAEEYFSLDSDFIGFMSNTGKVSRFPIKDKKERIIGWIYSYNDNRGIVWITLSFAVNDRITVYGVKAVITPKVLLNRDYLSSANEGTIKDFKERFNLEARGISPILGNIDLYSMSRGDYCINFHLNELNIPCTSEQMMTLIKMGNIPKHFKEWTKYDTTSKRQKADKNSFYLESDSVTLNYYNKYAQLIGDKNHPCTNKEDAIDLIRLEVQYGYRKLYSMLKNKVFIPNTTEPLAEIDIAELYNDMISYRHIAIPLDAMLADSIAEDVIRKYFYKVIRKGDYYTLATAKRIIQSENCHPKKKDRLISALTLINQCRGIYKAKCTLQGKDLEVFKRSIKDLELIGVNPVTIPREWNVEHISNLLDAYYNKIEGECENELTERRGNKIMKDYIKDYQKNRK